MAETIDYTRVIRDLEAKKARLDAEFDAAIHAIRQIVTIGGASNAQSSLFGLAAGSQPASPPQRYASGSMVDVAIKHLNSVGGGPVPNMELARALDEGGFPHKSKNFPNTLNSILHRRAKTVGDVRKVDRGWAIVRNRGEALGA
ncbi:MAG: hypothetical protein HY824_03720 [Acidobacteria bacterium]|nr:hypothetical protein [Acidobacteriota bacterium]